MSVQRYLILSFLAIRQNWLLTVGDVYLEEALWAGAGELSINARVLWVASGSGTLYGLYRRGGEIGGYLIGAVSAVCVAGGGRTF